MFLIVLKTAPITLSNGSGDFAPFVVVFTEPILKKNLRVLRVLGVKTLCAFASFA